MHAATVGQHRRRWTSSCAASLFSDRVALLLPSRAVASPAKHAATVGL